MNLLNKLKIATAGITTLLTGCGETISINETEFNNTTYAGLIVSCALLAYCFHKLRK